MSDFKKLAVWRKAHELTLKSYSATEAFPRSELFGLTSQIRRASASINANLAEGCSRGTDRELIRFLSIALGSTSELEYHFILALDLGFLTQEGHESREDLRKEVAGMLIGLRRKVEVRVTA